MSLLTVGTLLLMRGSIRATPRIGIRIYKSEMRLEVWGAPNDSGPYKLLAAYRVAALSGRLGPKRREGDLQGPEGFYYIDRFNPHSQFHLSLGLNYPNSSDRIAGAGHRLGGDVFIHGNQVSAGCFAMTDPVIDVIYALAIHARASGQRHIPVSIFPCRMTPANWVSLTRQYASNPSLVKFWATLLPAYRSFERSHMWPRPHVDVHGAYTWPELR